MNNIVEFVTYVQSIVKSCAGFIKTEGVFIHLPGTIVMRSYDASVLSVINIPIVYNHIFGGVINTFLNLKEDSEKENVDNGLYYIGRNIDLSNLEKTYGVYHAIMNNHQCISKEDDCFLIPGFIEASSSTEMSPLLYTGEGYRNFIVYVAKWLLPINKGDGCSLRLYKNNDVHLVRFIVHKKKLNLDINIMYNTIPYTAS